MTFGFFFDVLIRTSSLIILTKYYEKKNSSLVQNVVEIKLIVFKPCLFAHKVAICKIFCEIWNSVVTWK